MRLYRARVRARVSRRHGEEEGHVFGERGDAQVDGDGATEKLGEVGKDDADLGHDVEWVQEAPPVHELVPRVAVVQGEAAVRREICRTGPNGQGLCDEGYMRRRALPRRKAAEPAVTRGVSTHHSRTRSRAGSTRAGRGGQQGRRTG